METLHSQLDNLRVKITDTLAILTRNETDEAAIAEDGRNRSKLFIEWDRLKHCSISLSNFYEAEKISANIHKSIKRLEAKREENPTKIYKDALHRLDIQIEQDSMEQISQKITPYGQHWTILKTELILCCPMSHQTPK